MNEEHRLREHPARRFAAREHVLDLAKEFEALLQEPHPAVNGHRQKVLYKHGPVTLVIFAFEAGGFLKEHSAEGAVVIQCLEGSLALKTSGGEHRLGLGGLLLLAPGIRHDVTAESASRMLLTVNLEAEGG